MLERCGNPNTIQYRTDDNIKLDGQFYQLIIELGVHDYSGRPVFFANVIGTRWMNKSQVYRKIHEFHMDQELDKAAFIENYDLMTLFHYIVDPKKRDEILYRLFLSFIVKPAEIEEDKFIKNGRFTWFKRILPAMAKRHFEDIYRNRTHEVKQILEA